MNKLYTPAGEIEIECKPGKVSDGYHTFNELYSHRCLLFALLCSNWITAFKTRNDENGKHYTGWFIAGIETRYGQITYHMPEHMWNLVCAEVIERNVNYDGHTAKDVEERLRKLLKVGH